MPGTDLLRLVTIIALHDVFFLAKAIFLHIFPDTS